MTDEQKTIAFVTYPGLTVLDLVGPLQVLSGLAQYDAKYRVVVVGKDTAAVPTDTPLRIAPDRTFAEEPAPFAIVVPGGTAPTFRAMADETLLGWLRTAGAGAELITSVCTGALILGAAGFLEGRRAGKGTLFQRLRRQLALRGLVAARHTPGQDRNTFVMTRALATSLGISKLSDLRRFWPRA